MKECTTHHYCDCTGRKLKDLEALQLELKAIHFRLSMAGVAVKEDGIHLNAVSRIVELVHENEKLRSLLREVRQGA